MECEERMQELCDIGETLTSRLHQEISNMSYADTDEVGKVIDMIKDIYEAKKCCMEACYYKTVTEAMGRYGYSPEYHYTDRDVPYIQEYLNKINLTNRHNQEIDNDDRHSKAYREYQQSKKYYTVTHSDSDKDAMSFHAKEHVADTLTTIREIWKSADQELKKRMKADFTTLLSEMTV